MGQELSDIEQCRLAIQVFWQTRGKDESRDYGKTATGESFHYAEYLATNGDEGLRYGTSVWPHLKLRFDPNRGFYLNANGMESSDFEKFQDLFADEMATAGLRFVRTK